jgi:DNA-binding NarL/FixJ family response regulator
VVHPVAVIRAGLSVVLGDAALGQVSGTGSTFDALRLAAAHHPDIILFDFSTGSGPEAARLFAGLWPRPVLVGLVSPGSAIGPRECLDGGVDAAIALEGATSESILDTVRMAIEGRGPAVSGFRAAHATAGTVVTDSNPTSVLTRREREMLHLIGEGLSNREIAEVLGLSVKTVEAHRGNMSRKLNIRTRSGLMRVAMGALAG